MFYVEHDYIYMFLKENRKVLSNNWIISSSQNLEKGRES